MTQNALTDLHGRTWPITLTVGTLKRLRDTLSLDLLNKPQSLEKVADDPEQMVDVLYVVLKPRLDEAEISDIEFGESLTGESIGQGWHLLLEALVSFSQCHPIKHRAMLKARERMAAVETRMMDKVDQYIDDPRVDEAIDREIEIAGIRFFESLDTSVSTPNP